MASQLDHPPRTAMAAANSASARQAAKVKGFVDLQLEKTRKQVKTIDLIAGMLVLVAFTGSFLMLAVLIDAWIWPFSAVGRWICFALLVGGCLAYTVIAVVPLFLKRINLDYAAKMIEEAKPSFRNSLMNYVSLRKHADEIKPAVLDAVSRQAATDLASVPGDAAVDQSKLIRLGFVLIGLTLFAVGYKMLSPKDPLQSVARILAPAGKIAQPAVVKIENVEPGDTQVFFGEQLQVTASIRGSHRPEDVRLVYSTLDGQLTEQSIAMVPDGSSSQYRAELSMAGGGIQSSLRYHVVARDGASPDYEVIVRPNPSIAIESLDFVAPAYTKLAPRTLVGVGDIEAIEGTKVTVHAVANLPIKIASIELLNEVGDPNRPLGDVPYESRYKAAAAPIKMQTDGNSASGRIPVTLDSSGQKPFASHYRLRFVSTDGDRNYQPNVYPIRVIPDLAPEIEFRNPVQPDVEVPINGRLAIDIVASDLDFEIKSVDLTIEHQGNNLITQRLKLRSDDGYRRATAGYELRPGELGLKVGDRAVFFATAADNRISHSSEQPDPNLSRTQNYSVTVTDWDKRAEEEQRREKQQSSKQNTENSQEKSDDQNSQDQANQGQSGDDAKEAGDSGSSSDDKDEGNEGNDESQEGAEKGQEGDSETPGSQGGSSEKNPSGDSAGKGGGTSGEKPSGDDGSEKTEDKSSEGQGLGDGSPESKNNDSDQNSQGGNQNSGGSSNPDDSQNESSTGDGSQPSDELSNSDNSSAGDPAASGSQQPAGADGNQQSKTEDPSSEGISDEDLASEGGDGQKDDSLTDGSKERMSKNASDGERIKELLQDFLNDEKESNPETGESDSENPQSGDQSQQPGDQSSSDGDPSQQPGEGPQKPNQQRADSGNQSGSQPDDSSELNENGDPGSSSQQKPGNESSAEGQVNPNKGAEPSDPRTAKYRTAEDSDSNDSPREQSTKPGMEDATGKQSQDPGGEETDKTGNQSGGTDPGQSQSRGDDSGKPESGNPNSNDSQQANPGQGENSESNSSDPGNQTGSQNQSGEPGKQSENVAQSGKPQGEKSVGSSQSQPTPGGEGPGDASAGGIGGEGGTSGELLEREKTNFEHARKATDMVLKKLSEQRYDPDPELLDKMNWTKQDMEKFLRRWEEMKIAAEQGNPTAKKKYERSLKSLNLRPKNDRRTAKQLNETAEGLSEDSAVSRPPPERVPDYNSFLKDLNRANGK